MTDKLVDRLREATLYEAHGEASSLPESAADAIEAQQTRIVELNQELYHPDQIYAHLLAVITDIRGRSGLGAKPMLSELAQAIGDRIHELEEIASVSEMRANDRGIRIRALEEALRPFEKAADAVGANHPDDARPWIEFRLGDDILESPFTVADLRRAKQALEGARSDAGWPTGTRVRKKSGSWWEGRVVGRYSTEQTQDGYCVQLERPHGPVQIYPASALESADDR